MSIINYQLLLIVVWYDDNWCVWVELSLLGLGRATRACCALLGCTLRVLHSVDQRNNPRCKHIGNQQDDHSDNGQGHNRVALASTLGTLGTFALDAHSLAAAQVVAGLILALSYCRVDILATLTAQLATALLTSLLHGVVVARNVVKSVRMLLYRSEQSHTLYLLSKKVLHSLEDILILDVCGLLERGHSSELLDCLALLARELRGSEYLRANEELF